MSKKSITKNRNLVEDNKRLASVVMQLRAELESVNHKLALHEAGEKPPVISVPDIRTRADLKHYLRDGFRGSNLLDRRKALMTFQINKDYTTTELYAIINEVENEIQRNESEEFLQERNEWVKESQKWVKAS